MLELAIVSAGGAGLGIVASIAIWTGWRRAADAERRAGEMASKASVLDGKLLAATVAADAWKTKAEDQERRVSGLQDILVQTANDLPPGEQRSVLQARWFNFHHGTVAAAKPGVSVPEEPRPTRSSDLDLLRPGED